MQMRMNAPAKYISTRRLPKRACVRAAAPAYLAARRGGGHHAECPQLCEEARGNDVRHDALELLLKPRVTTESQQNDSA